MVAVDDVFTRRRGRIAGMRVAQGATRHPEAIRSTLEWSRTPTDRRHEGRAHEGSRRAPSSDLASVAKSGRPMTARLASARKLRIRLAEPPAPGSFSDAELEGLPEPVRRYLGASIDTRHAAGRRGTLPDAWLDQAGTEIGAVSWPADRSPSRRLRVGRPRRCHRRFRPLRGRARGDELEGPRPGPRHARRRARRVPKRGRPRRR